MAINRKPGRITLEMLCPILQYAGAVLLSIAYPQLPETIAFLPGVQLPRVLLALWVILLLILSILLDHAAIRARAKDAAELRDHVRNGGLNHSTLLALALPALFILNAAAIFHLYWVYLHSAQASSASFSQRSAAMAVGIVLFIYGRSLPKIRFGSVWGIRTKQTLSEPMTWAKAHLAASLPVTLCGAIALAAGFILPETLSLLLAACGCIAAFGVMFLRK